MTDHAELEIVGRAYRQLLCGLNRCKARIDDGNRDGLSRAIAWTLQTLSALNETLTVVDETSQGIADFYRVLMLSLRQLDIKPSLSLLDKMIGPVRLLMDALDAEEDEMLEGSE